MEEKHQHSHTFTMHIPLAGQKEKLRDRQSPKPSLQPPAARGADQTWSATRRLPEAQEALTPISLSAPIIGEPSRFEAPVLAPIARERRLFRRKAPNLAATTSSHQPQPDRRMRLLDRALLVAELASALVVAWLVGQYLYTIYFDTAPRRITPPPKTGGQIAGVGQRSTPVPAKPNPTETPRIETLAQPTVETDGRWRESLGGVAEAPKVPTPTATASVDPQLLLPTRLRIPAMFLDSPVHEVKVNMGKWEVSAMYIGHHEGTGNPGQTGNVVLAGHRDINSALFRYLDRLKPGDELFVQNGLGKEYRYIVQESFVVAPTQTDVMADTGDKRVTLITCTPIGIATQRLIVTATLDE